MPCAALPSTSTTSPLTGSDSFPTLSLPGLGPRRVCFVRNQTVCFYFPSRRGRGHRGYGLKISGRLLSVLCFPCRGPSAWCWRPLLFHSSRVDRGSDRSSKPDPPLGSNCCGPLPSGRRPFFFPSAPAPRGAQAKAADSLPKRNGAACHTVVIPRPTAANARRFPFPAGRHFFKEYPHAPR